MNDVNYNVQQYPWYSPLVIIQSVNRIARIYGHHIEDKREFKLVREMFAAAIALLGAYELHPDNKFFLQPNFQSTSPDVMSAKQVVSPEKHVDLELNQIEIVTMNEHATTDDVVEFLKQTKLSPKKAYSSKTMIVLIVNRKIQIDRRKISDEIKALNAKPTIYILGKFAQQENTWTIFSPYPLLTKLVIFKPYDTIRKYSLPGSITLHKKPEKEIKYVEAEKVETTVQQIFQINEAEVEKYRVV